MLQSNYSGRILGDFILEERIGRGGMASVYRAFQPSVSRYVALKIISLDPELDLGDQEEFRHRFAQEAAVIASLEHIHILPIYSYDLIPDDVAYIAMRLLPGGSLAERIAQGPLPLAETTRVFRQVAAGLSYAHRRGVIHRDLKPSNILFDGHENAYLTDFGLAKLVEVTVSLTRTGNIIGTPAYVSPEQFRNNVVDARADIYSMGILLYHMLTGQLPFDLDEGGILSLIRKHLEAEPPPLRVSGSALPEAVEAVVMRALNKDPNARYGDATDMAEALNSAVASGTSASYPVAKIPLLRPPMQRRFRVALKRRAVIAAFVLVAVIGTIGVAEHFRRTSMPTRPVVLTGMVGTSNDTAPSNDEIARAREHLGANGFVAFVACNLSTELNAIRAREMRDVADSYQLPLRVYDADSNATLQPGLIDQALAEGAQAIVLCPFNARMLAPALTRLQEAQVPLVLVSELDSSYGGVTLTWNNHLLGLTQGRFVGEWIRDERDGQAKVLILDFPGLPGLVVRADAIESAIMEYAPDAEIIGRYSGESIRETAQEVVADLLAQGLEFDVIAAINDASALGAIAALEEAKVDPSAVAVFGINGEQQAREYIRQGYFMRATLPNDIETSALSSINAAIKLLAGSAIPENIRISPGEMITRENVDTTSPIG